MQLVANNKKAYHNYFVEEKIVAGLCLEGSEVKSLRNGNCSIKEAYIKVDKGEVYIIGMYVKNFEQINTFKRLDERRTKKLLLTKKEIRKLESILANDGYTIVPLQVYFADNNRAKIEIAIAKGKKNYDKRESIKKAEQKREIDRHMKNYNR